MEDTATHIRHLKDKIYKLEKDFKRGVPPFMGFTIDVFYGGNEEVDIPRFEIGSIAHEEKTGEIFYNLILSSLKASLDHWKNIARIEIESLTKSLE